MRKTWNFEVKGHSIKVVNTWFHGAKLYVDGEFRDHDDSYFAFGGEVMLSANLGDLGVIEIEPRAFFTVEIDVFLTKEGNRQPVFSSRNRLSLSQQRESR
ncbi:hypothetical protein [Alishewanella tabrizica]|uniref:Uncharacterized protein n=1 Tax=Alishewanella tabrizica TaxID=671278 RepID=A0ABQ2WPQ0_9ALTE|nr:hypothetical protein [Alishewanella tabrizica]GGW64024.1 hypothetical protein GCM10008111_19870 [Alishewanella tabrizica]